MFHLFLSQTWAIALVWMTAVLPVHGPKRAASFLEIAHATEGACGADLVCASELVAIAFYESNFSTWAHGKAGEIGPWQLMPAHLPSRSTSILEQAFLARDLIAKSKRDCFENPPRAQLAEYASGDCRRGWRESEHRLLLARDLLNVAPGATGADHTNVVVGHAIPDR